VTGGEGLAILRRAAGVGALALLGACAAHREDLVVVVPAPDGHVGKVVVQAGHDSATLETANAGSRIDANYRLAPVTLTGPEIQAEFGAALAARPIPPHRFTLYFDEGTERLAPDSTALLSEILADTRSRAAYEINVVGHTDRLADEKFNAQLSDRRAGFVRDWLVGNAVPVETITVAGRGELDPVVPTDDGVAEPRNRRVEVTIR